MMMKGNGREAVILYWRVLWMSVVGVVGMTGGGGGGGGAGMVSALVVYVTVGFFLCFYRFNDT